MGEGNGNGGGTEEREGREAATVVILDVTTYDIEVVELRTSGLSVMKWCDF